MSAKSFQYTPPHPRLKIRWPEDSGAFGKLWAIAEKGAKNNSDAYYIYPSILEVLTGLYIFHCEQVATKMEVVADAILNFYKESQTRQFNFLLASSILENINQPLTEEVFKDPYSPEVQLILYLYSMEPHFYTDLEVACQNMDTSKLKSLGPYAKALFGVLEHGWQSDRKREDALEIGCTLEDSDPVFEYARCFLLFKGALVDEDDIEDWKREALKSRIRLHGTTRATSYLELALHNSKCDAKYGYDQEPILFIFAIKN